MNYFLSFLSSGSIVHRKSTYRPDYPRSIPDENEKSLNDRPRSCMAFQFGRTNKYWPINQISLFFWKKEEPIMAPLAYRTRLSHWLLDRFIPGSSISIGNAKWTQFIEPFYFPFGDSAISKRIKKCISSKMSCWISKLLGPWQPETNVEIDDGLYHPQGMRRKFFN